MPEPLAIVDGDILERLRARFGLEAESVEFLPLASDADVRGYRVRSREGDRFLKIRRGPVSEVGLSAPLLLSARGIRHLITPIPTVTGSLFDGDDVAFILFPFVEGVSGGRIGLSATQWAELGATVRAIHDLSPENGFASILRAEDFMSPKIGLLHEVEESIDRGELGDDPVRNELAGLWRSHRDQIGRLAAHTEALAPRARGCAGPGVICHADIHAWNVLVTPSGDIVIVDWDEAMLAPRERDLMFVDGVAGGHAADPPAFFDGYGGVEPDPVVMTYYRVEWAVQDLAGYGARIFLDPDADDDAKAESFDIIARMFAPGSEIDVVVRAAEALDRRTS